MIVARRYCRRACLLALLAVSSTFTTALAGSAVQDAVVAATDPLHRKIETLKETIDSLEGRHDTLEAATDGFRIKAKSLKEKLGDERSRYDTLVTLKAEAEGKFKVEIDDLSEQLKTSELRAGSLTDSLENAIAAEKQQDALHYEQLNESIEEASQWKERLRKVVTENEELSNTVKLRDANLAEFANTLKLREEEVTQAKSKYFDLNQDLLTTTQRLEDMVELNQELSTTLKIHDENLALLSSTLKIREEEAVQAESEHVDLSQELLATNQRLGDMVEANQELASTLQIQGDKLANVTSTLKLREEEATQAESIYFDLRQELVATSQRLEEMVVTNEELSSSLQLRDGNLAELAEALKLHEEEATHAEAEYFDLNQELLATNQVLEDIAEANQKLATTMKIHDENLAQLSSTLKIREEEATQAESEHFDLSQELLATNQRLEDMVEANQEIASTLQIQGEKLANVTSTLKLREEEATQAESKYFDLSQELVTTNEQSQKLVSTLKLRDGNLVEAESKYFNMSQVFQATSQRKAEVFVANHKLSTTLKFREENLAETESKYFNLSQAFYAAGKRKNEIVAENQELSIKLKQRDEKLAEAKVQYFNASQELIFVKERLREMENKSIEFAVVPEESQTLWSWLEQNIFLMLKQKSNTIKGGVGSAIGSIGLDTVTLQDIIQFGQKIHQVFVGRSEFVADSVSSYCVSKSGPFPSWLLSQSLIVKAHSQKIVIGVEILLALLFLDFALSSIYSTKATKKKEPTTTSTTKKPAVSHRSLLRKSGHFARPEGIPRTNSWEDFQSTGSLQDQKTHVSNWQ